MKKIRFIDNATQAHIREVNDFGQMKDVERGHTISPFDTPKGRVVWRVDYVEQVDMDMLFVYITHLGFQQK